MTKESAKSIINQRHTPTKEPTMLSNMKDGFSLGVGVSVARNLVDSLFTKVKDDVLPTPSVVNDSSSENVLKLKIQEYKKCMEETKNDSEGCKHWLN